MIDSINSDSKDSRRKWSCEFSGCKNEYKYYIHYFKNTKLKRLKLCFSCYYKCTVEKIDSYKGKIITTLIKFKNGESCNYEVLHKYKNSYFHNKYPAGAGKTQTKIRNAE